MAADWRMPFDDERRRRSRSRSPVRDLPAWMRFDSPYPSYRQPYSSRRLSDRGWLPREEPYPRHSYDDYDLYYEGRDRYRSYYDQGPSVRGTSDVVEGYRGGDYYEDRSWFIDEEGIRPRHDIPRYTPPRSFPRLSDYSEDYVDFKESARELNRGYYKDPPIRKRPWPYFGSRSSPPFRRDERKSSSAPSPPERKVSIKDESRVLIKKEGIKKEPAEDESHMPMKNENMKKEPAATVKTPFYCKDCNVYATSETLLQNHFKGSKHLKKTNKQTPVADEATPPAVVDPEDGVKLKVCSICGQHVKGDEHFNEEEHKTSKRHVEWMGKFKKQCPKGKIPVDKSIFNDVVYSSDDADEVMRLEEDSTEGYRCSTCNITLRNYSIYKQHVAGARHKKTIRKQATTDNPRTRHHCNVCDIDIQGDRSLKEHLEGQKHRKKVSQNVDKEQSVDDDNASPISKIPTIHCEICDAVCSSQFDFERHINGKQHKKKAKKKRTG